MKTKTKAPNPRRGDSLSGVLLNFRATPEERASIERAVAVLNDPQFSGPADRARPVTPGAFARWAAIRAAQQIAPDLSLRQDLMVGMRFDAAAKAPNRAELAAGAAPGIKPRLNASTSTKRRPDIDEDTRTLPLPFADAAPSDAEMAAAGLPVVVYSKARKRGATTKPSDATELRGLILALAERRPVALADVLDFGVTRSRADSALVRLMQSGELVRTGAGKAMRWTLKPKRSAPAPLKPATIALLASPRVAIVHSPGHAKGSTACGAKSEHIGPEPTCKTCRGWLDGRKAAARPLSWADHAANVKRKQAAKRGRK